MKNYSKRYTEEYKERYIIRMKPLEYKVFHKLTGKQISLYAFTSRQLAKLYIDRVRGHEECQKSEAVRPSLYSSK